MLLSRLCKLIGNPLVIMPLNPTLEGFSRVLKALSIAWLLSSSLLAASALLFFYFFCREMLQKQMACIMFMSEVESYYKTSLLYCCDTMTSSIELNINIMGTKGKKNSIVFVSLI